MNLLSIGFLSVVLCSYCFNRGQFPCLLNFSNLNTGDIEVRDSTINQLQERIYTPKSGVQIHKVKDGVQVIWEDKQKLTQCVKATTYSKKNLIHLIHLNIKRTAKVNEEKYFKRLDAKFVNISDKEYDLLKLDSDQLTDNSIYFDLNARLSDDRLFKTVVRPMDGVPTLLLEPLQGYKLVAVYDDFRTVWTKKSSSSYVENLIAYYFFSRYYLVMLKLRVNDEVKYLCFMFKESEWHEIPYYTFMNRFLMLKAHIPITGHLTFNILELPGDEEYLIEKDEKYGIELSTYYPRRGFILNSVMKGEQIIWESANERCCSIRLVKKKGTIYGLNLSLVGDRDERTTVNFSYQDHVYRSVSEEDFKEFAKNLVDPSEFQKYQEEHPKNNAENPENESEVIIEEPDENDESKTSNDEEVYSIPKEDVEDQSPRRGEETPPQRDSEEDHEAESGTRKQKESPPQQEETPAEQHSESHLLDISDHNTRLFLKNNFKLENLDTYEYIPMPGVKVSSIIDGSIPIWENKKGTTLSRLYVHYRNDLTQLLKLVTRVKTGDVFHFFKRLNANFLEIDNQEYDKLFQKMSNSINLLDNSVLLSLSTTPQEQYFDYSNEFDDGVNVSKYVTKSIFKLAKITDRQKVLWQSTNNEKCSSVTRNKFYKGSELLQLNISEHTVHSTKYFKKLDLNFSEIDADTFNSDYKTFKDSIPFISNVSLNINTAPNEVNFLCTEKTEGTFTHSSYYPKSGYVLNKVSSGSIVFWTSTRNRCKRVSVFKGQNSQKLVRLSFSNTTTPDLFFNLVNGKFVKLRNYMEFDFIFKEYNRPESEEDLRSFCNSHLEREFKIDPDVNKIYLNTNIETNNIYTCFNPDLVMNKIFVPKDGFIFNHITDGNVILFSSRSDSNLCLYIHVFYDHNGPRLAKLRTSGVESNSKGDLLYLEISDNQTKNLTSDEFETKLNSLKEEMNKLQESQNKKITLDISQGHPESEQKTSKFRGLDYKEFKSNQGFFFSKVIFSPELVYSLDAEEDCNLVRTYFFLDFPVLAELHFLLPGENTAKLNLYRFKNELMTLENQHYDNLVRSISELVSKCAVLELGDFMSFNQYETRDPEASQDSQLKHKLFSSGNKYFTSVIVNNSKLWAVNSDLFLTKQVGVYYLSDNPYLLKLSLESLDHDQINLFFEFKNNNWNSINYTEYTNKVNKNTATDSEEQGTESDLQELFDVDITKNINTEHVSYRSGKANSVTYVEATVKNDSNGLRSVSENGKLMWESSKQDLICKKSLVYYFNNIPQLLKLTLLSQFNQESFLYKHVSNGYWLEIDEDIFNRKLASFESLSKDTRESDPIVKVLSKLDTSKIDKNFVRFTTHESDNLTYNQYKPTGKSLFVEVVDGTEIWKSDSDYECNLVRIYLYKESSVLCKLFLTNDLGVDLYLYFNNSVTGWNKISSSEFESHLCSLRLLVSDQDSTDEGDSSESADESADEDEVSEEPTSSAEADNVFLIEELSPEESSPSKVELPEDSDDDSADEIEVELPDGSPVPPNVEEEAGDTPQVELDISHLDSPSFNIEQGSQGNISFTKVKVNPDSFVREVKDGDSTIWTSSDSSQCTFVKIYKDGSSNSLGEIVVKNERSKMKFVAKVNGVWTVVSEDEFNTLYDSLPSNSP